MLYKFSVMWDLGANPTDPDCGRACVRACAVSCALISRPQHLADESRPAEKRLTTDGFCTSIKDNGIENRKETVNRGRDLTGPARNAIVQLNSRFNIYQVHCYIRETVMARL